MNILNVNRRWCCLGEESKITVTVITALLFWRFLLFFLLTYSSSARNVFPSKVCFLSISIPVFKNVYVFWAIRFVFNYCFDFCTDPRCLETETYGKYIFTCKIWISMYSVYASAFKIVTAYSRHLSKVSNAFVSFSEFISVQKMSNASWVKLIANIIQQSINFAIDEWLIKQEKESRVLTLGYLNP